MKVFAITCSIIDNLANTTFCSSLELAKEKLKYMLDTYTLTLHYEILTFNEDNFSVYAKSTDDVICWSIQPVEILEQ